MDATVTAGLIELAKFGIQSYLQAMKMAGKTDQEIEQMFQDEKRKFLERRPEDLPNV